MRLKAALPAILVIAGISLGAARSRPSEKLDLTAFPRFMSPTPSVFDRFLMRINRRLESPKDRVHYSVSLNVHQMSDAAVLRLVRELEEYLRLDMLQANEERHSVSVIGLCARLPYARALLRKIAMDSLTEPELRRLAVGCFMPNELAPLPDRAYLESVEVLRKYLRSPEAEDRETALGAVGEVTMRPLERELLAMYAREPALSVKVALLRSYGWCAVPGGFDLVERESHSAYGALKAAAVNALSHYAVRPTSIPLSDQRRLRRRLEALRKQPEFAGDVEFAMSHIGSAGLTAPNALPIALGPPGAPR